MANPQKIKAKVIDIASYGRQVYKLTFKTEKKFPRFKAGQFLHLTLDNFDPTTGFWPESRVFSIASCSDDRKEVTIVYSVKGVYTKRMEKTLSVGTSVWLKAPFGEFIISKYIQENETAILIAGGTGVSPFIPFLKQSGSSVKIELNYGLKNKDLMIFKNDLETVLNKDNFQLNLYLEEISDNLSVSGNLTVMEGLLSVDSILEGVQELVKEHDLWFIEDCCDALGSTYKEKMLGTLPKGYDHKYVYSHIGYNLKVIDMQAAIGVM